MYKWAAVICLSVLTAWPHAAAAENAPVALDMPGAIAMALENNHLIKSAAETIRAAIEQQYSAKADMLPQAAAAYGYTRLSDVPFMYFPRYVVSPDGRVTGVDTIEAPLGPQDNYHWNISLRQPLFTGFALRTRYQMAQTGVAIRSVEKQQAIQDVIKQVKVAYLNILLTEKLVAVAEKTVHSLRGHRDQADQFYRQGMIAYNDFLQSEVALADVLQREAEVQGNAQIAKARLSALLALDMIQPIQVKEMAPAQPAVPELPPLLDQAISQRTELKALRLSLQHLQQAQKLAQSAYYPTVAVVGSYEQNGEDWRATENNYNNSHNASLTLQAQWTFFEWGKTRSQVARYRHDYQALSEKIRSIEDSIRLEVNNAWIALTVADKNIQTAAHALNQAKENLRITNVQYDRQMATTFDVLDANTHQARAQSNYYTAVYGFMSAMAELERAVGTPVNIQNKGNIAP